MTYRNVSISTKLLFACILCAFCGALRATTPPFKAMYSNDTTNLLTCESPYHKAEDKTVTEAMIRASVAEAAVPGIDAQILQPGMGAVPWWPSKVAPLAEQEAWFEAHYNIKPKNEYHDFLRNGGDLVGVFLDECKKHAVAGIVSLRLNDAHHLEYAWGDNGLTPQDWMVQSISKFYVTHPEWVLPPRPGAGGMQGRGMNWLFEGPRDYKLSLLSELLAQYDLDALELDFLRFPYYFPDDTPMPQRVAVMTDFIRKAKSLVQARNAQDGKHRLLIARVPAAQREWARVGFDPAAFAAAGIDVFNASANYCTTQQTDLAALRAAAPQTPIYYELTHTAQVRHLVKGYDGFVFRRNTPEMLDTTARVAYARGADGISAFNFAYYRTHGPSPATRGPFDEPPFAALAHAADKAAILKEAPAYFFNAVNDSRDVTVPPQKPQTYRMDIVPPADANARKPVLRLMVLTEAERNLPEGAPAQSDANRGQWRVTLNGQLLTPIPNAFGSYPYPSAIRAGFGRAEQYLAFAVPPASVKDGVNEVVATLQGKTAQPLTVRWVELWYPQAEKIEAPSK